MTVIRHPELDLSAPAEYWHAFGDVCGGAYAVSGTGDEAYLHVNVMRSSGVTAVLLQGIDHTGTHDEHAIVWAIGELQRRREERARNDARLKEAEALLKVAEALGRSGEHRVLEDLLARLTLRTRTAVEEELGT